MRIIGLLCAAAFALAFTGASAQENYESWKPLTSSFLSTGGNGIMIKGYDPVITGDKCVTSAERLSAV